MVPFPDTVTMLPSSATGVLPQAAWAFVTAPLLLVPDDGIGLIHHRPRS
jgi:hypothetical protein